MPKVKGLIVGHLEKVERSILKAHKDVVKRYVKGKHGLYALYKKDKLYYVGLAIDLPKRIAHHLKDRHRHTWDRFSLYVIKDASYLKEMESLFLRIYKPKGNATKGKFAASKNLKPDFKREIDAKTRRQLGVRRRKTGGKKGTLDKGEKKTPSRERYSEEDMIIVPARKEGFEQVFLGEHCWYAIRFNPKRTPYVKHIAAYQIRPISAVTHYAKVTSIKPYKKTGKYIVYFEKPRKLRQPIGLKKTKTARVKNVQGPVFTTRKAFKSARTLDDL